MINFIRYLLLSTSFAVLMVWHSVSTVSAADTFLSFQVADDRAAKISLSLLKQELKIQHISLFNPLMDKNKQYAAFALKDVLDFVYQDQWRSKQYSDIGFIALDGYQAVSQLDKLKETGGYLAFEDLDEKPGWEPVGYKQANPGPFFLVWTGKHQTTSNAYPWPWQIASLNLLRFEDQYAAIVPKGIEQDSAVYRGFGIFRERCLRCHSMDQVGGKIGPDLNAPQSITAYRSEHMIKEFIKHPSQYRHTQMPDHTDLSDTDLDALYDYFIHKAIK